MKPKYYIATLCILAVAVVTTSYSKIGSPTTTMTKERQSSMSPDHAYQELIAGNARFVEGRTLDRNLKEQVKTTAEGQHPFATIVSCLDSRTSTELIFDQGIGDVFNARIAGNIVNPDILGSLEFASKAAGSKLIAVIGHTKCGAVKGACDNVELGNLTGLIDKIEPAVAATQSAAGEERSSKNSIFVDRVARTNVVQTIENIRKNSSILREMEAAGQIKIVGGMYDLETGKVTFMN